LLCSFLPLRKTKTVNDDLDGVLLLFIQVDLITQIEDLSVDAYAYIARAAHILRDVFVFSLTTLN